MGGMLIGLTGTYGSGKTLVADALADCGAAVIDADTLAHQAVEPGRPALEAIRRQFGEAYIQTDGTLDRGRMAQTVFASPERRRELEQIVHPAVRTATHREIRRLREESAAADTQRVIVLNVPLLFEAGMDAMADHVVVVTVNEAARFRRLRLRDGVGERQIVQRLGAQWSQRLKAERADTVIDNSGPPEMARAAARRLYASWVHTAEEGGQAPLPAMQ